MASLKYPLKRGGPERLTVTHDRKWKDVHFSIDDETIGSVVDDPRSLRQGVTYTLADDSTLMARLVGQQLQLHRNGKALPGSIDDPEKNVKTAAGALYSIGFFALVIGLFGVFGREFIAQYSPAEAENISNVAVFSYIIGGVIFFVLAYLTQMKNSMAALLAGTLIYALLAISSMISSLNSPGTEELGTNAMYVSLVVWVVVILAFLNPMVQGILALRKIKAEMAEG